MSQPHIWLQPAVRASQPRAAQPGVTVSLCHGAPAAIPTAAAETSTTQYD
ncbi:MAG: hypothetical protein ACRDRN_22575 [Sciscionella sp.]